jgi:hypothetical protein
MPDERHWHTRTALTRSKRVDLTRPTHQICTNEVLDRVIDHSIP